MSYMVTNQQFYWRWKSAELKIKLLMSYVIVPKLVLSEHSKKISKTLFTKTKRKQNNS